MKTKILFIMLIVLLFFSGCEFFNKTIKTTVPDLNVSKETEKISDDVKELSGMLDEFIDENLLNIKKTIEKTEEIKIASSEIQKETKTIKESLNIVDENTNKIEQKAGESVKHEVTAIKEESISIFNSTTGIENRAVLTSLVSDEIIDNLEKQKDSIKETIQPVNNSLITKSEEIKNVSKSVEGYEETMKKVEKEREEALEAKIKAEEARDSSLHKALRWIVVSSIVGAGVLGVFGFMYRSKLSLTLSTMCVVVMSIAIFVETYFIYIVIAGGVILVALMVMLVYNIIVQKKAFKEVVDTVEITKSNLPIEKKEELFGKNGQTGIMDTIQSPETISLVKQEKAKMSSLWKYAKKK